MPDFDDFDESDPAFMAALSQAMAQHIPRVFPAEMEVSGETHTLRFAVSANMRPAEVERFLDTVNTCLGPFYAQHKGPRWKAEKREEMQEPGLVYLWYEAGASMSCFVSLMMVLEPAGKTLYLYEIHVLPPFQGQRIGARLIDRFHRYGRFLNEHTNFYQHFSCVAAGLTVFSDNEKALRWYLKLGYTYSPDSPVDRRLRNGRNVKPDFYTLTKSLLSDE